MNREDGAVSNPSSNAEFGGILRTVSRRRVLKGGLVAVTLACLWTAANLFVTGRVVVATNGESASTLTQEEVTIPRVGNPPLTSDLVNLPGDLRTVAVPGPSNLPEFVRDSQMARALGKALFWDMQVGSDGVQACASCHFRAGADPRSKNQLSPGLLHAGGADLTYTTGGGPNAQLQTSDFPLSRLTNPTVRGALDPLSDSDDAVSSQGVHHLGDGIDPQGFHVGNVAQPEPLEQLPAASSRATPRQ